jgi:hypothetical protein
MLETSSRCSSRNQCRNCSPTRSFSSRARRASATIWSVTARSCSSASSTGATAPGYRHRLVGVEQVLHDHHRVVPLLDGLAVEVRGEVRQRLGVVVDGDRDVLLRGAELAPDLLVQLRRKPAHGAEPNGRSAD